MDSCQVSVVDLDQLVQVFCFLYLVLKLQSSAVQNLSTNKEGIYPKTEKRTRFQTAEVDLELVLSDCSVHQWLFSGGSPIFKKPDLLIITVTDMFYN